MHNVRMHAFNDETSILTREGYCIIGQCMRCHFTLPNDALPHRNVAFINLLCKMLR